VKFARSRRRRSRSVRVSPKRAPADRAGGSVHHTRAAWPAFPETDTDMKSLPSARVCPDKCPDTVWTLVRADTGKPHRFPDATHDIDTAAPPWPVLPIPSQFEFLGGFWSVLRARCCADKSLILLGARTDPNSRPSDSKSDFSTFPWPALVRGHTLAGQASH
jgi:hypothetical protein